VAPPREAVTGTTVSSEARAATRDTEWRIR
jgi:hypothetical protein